MPRPRLGIDSQRQTFELARSVNPPDNGRFETFEDALVALLEWAEEQQREELATIGGGRDVGELLEEQPKDDSAKGGALPKDRSNFL